MVRTIAIIAASAFAALFSQNCSAYTLTRMRNGCLLMTADEGKCLRRKGETTTEPGPTSVALAASDSPDNWEEYVPVIEPVPNPQ